MFLFSLDDFLVVKGLFEEFGEKREKSILLFVRRYRESKIGTIRIAVVLASLHYFARGKAIGLDYFFHPYCSLYKNGKEELSYRVTGSIDVET